MYDVFWDCLFLWKDFKGKRKLEAMNTMSLEEKNIIITGAASGIGRETALLCQKLGAKLLLLDLNKQGLMDVIRLL